MYVSFFKRFFDFVFSLLALFFLSPLFSLLVVILFFTGKGCRVFFTQERPGKDGKIFRLIKFTSMDDKRDSGGDLLPDKDRITGAGKFLRKTSLDELPQLLNVLKGDMSFVGPRPLLVQYLSLYSPEQMRRHEVRPGITGWAQVNGRNALSWEEKFQFDVWYVDNCSFWLDIRILVMTVQKVFLRKGIDYNDDQTMPVFTGTSEKK